MLLQAARGAVPATPLDLVLNASRETQVVLVVLVCLSLLSWGIMFAVWRSLGKATKADSIEIRWNSGKVETIKDVTADKFYAVLEGEGIVPVEKIRPKLKK